VADASCPFADRDPTVVQPGMKRCEHANHPPARASWSSPAAGRRRRQRACALPSPACHIRLAALTRRSPPTKTQALQRRPLRIPGSAALCRRAAPRPGERHPGSR
jgi:hypothetical protein